MDALLLVLEKGRMSTNWSEVELFLGRNLFHICVFKPAGKFVCKVSIHATSRLNLSNLFCMLGPRSVTFSIGVRM